MSKFVMKMYVNVARLEIGHLFTKGHPCTLDTFLFLFKNTLSTNVTVVSD